MQEIVVELSRNGEVAAERVDRRDFSVLRDVRVEGTWIAQTRAEYLIRRLVLGGFFTIKLPGDCGWGAGPDLGDDGPTTVSVVAGDLSRAVTMSNSWWACQQLDDVKQVIDEVLTLAHVDAMPY
jgi:hypothetical protein